MSDAGRSRLSPRARLIAAIVGVLAAAGLMVALNWNEITKTPAGIEFVVRHPSDRDIEVKFASCPSDYTVSVDEHDEEVRVRVWLDEAPTDDCALDVYTEPFTLEAPLGDRPVVDASTGMAVPVYALPSDPNEG